jgi:hypothetical protein
MFALTLPKDDTCPLESVDDIKQCIIETIEKLPYWGEELPISWVVFEEELRKWKKTLKIIKIEKLHTLCEGVSELVVFENTGMKDALRFFNEIGSILYFDSADLEETVILDVQWFVNSFKNIITDRQDLRLTDRDFELWEQFYHTGEINDKLLKSIWRATDDFGEPFLDHKNELLNYMQHLGLLARGSKETNNIHLIPCMTKRRTSKEITEKYTQDSVFSYKFDFFPNFIFWRFVVACVCSPGWAILESGGQKCIFKDTCILSYDTVEVVIKINDDILDVQIVGHQISCNLGGLKIKILREIKELLHRLTKTFHTDIAFTTGCRCKAKTVFELRNAGFLSEAELRKIKSSSSKQCSVCDESHEVAVGDLSAIFEEVHA